MKPDERGQTGQTWLVKEAVSFPDLEDVESVLLVLEELPQGWKRCLDLETGEVKGMPWYCFSEGVGRRIG